MPLYDIPPRIQEFEQVLKDWISKDPQDAYREAHRKDTQTVTLYNTWIKEEDERLRAAKQPLDQRFAELEDIKKTLLDLERLTFTAPSPSDRAAVDRHLELLNQHRILAMDYRERSNGYLQLQQQYNNDVRNFNEEKARREEELKAVRQELNAAERLVERYRYWRNDNGEAKFQKGLNTLFAELHEMLPLAGSNTSAVQSHIDKVRGLRQELFAYARTREEEKPNGFLIAQTTICGNEAFHVVDNASSSVTLSPELVRVLGLTDKLGHEVDVIVLGGLKARGRHLIIPSVAVGKWEAKDVEGIQLVDSQLGVDGCLGLTFLNRFEFKIFSGKPQRLELSPKGQPLNQNTGYDVFISYHSPDEWLAHVIYDALKLMNYRPFFAKVELGGTASPDYHTGIENAILTSRHFVVVGSSPEHMEEAWPRKERMMFQAAKQKQRIEENIVPVCCGTMKPDDLPMALGYRQSLHIADKYFREGLRKILPLA